MEGFGMKRMEVISIAPLGAIFWQQNETYKIR